MRLSPEYLALNEQMHRDSSFYGASGHKSVFIVKDLMERYGAETVLDYGCGKGGLKAKLDLVNNYDPAVPEFSKEPAPADLVVCVDVMEHVEPECVDDVLAHVASLTKKAAYFLIALTEAKKILPDGRNAHICIREQSWWEERLKNHFSIRSADLLDRGVRYVVEPLQRG